MGLFSFVREAGQKLLGITDDAAETSPGISVTAPAQPVVSASTLHGMLAHHGLAPDDLSMGFRDGTATVSGTAAAAADREKIILALGNTRGVAEVDDQLKVEGEAPEPVFCTVKSGDTLSGIAKEQYGNAMKFPAIFEANRPMLSDPNKIYPGQVLRIPALEK
jgi:nucleoid-associated protein YgaU